MDFSKVFEEALKSALNDIITRRFTPQSEADIQAIIFHHALLLMPDSTQFIEIHVEPTKEIHVDSINIERPKPDIVFGQNDVFIEIKFLKTAETNALTGCKKDIDKLIKYKQQWPNAKCVFIAIDETGRLSGGKRGRSVNFFDPSDYQLKGQWKALTDHQNILIANL